MTQKPEDANPTPAEEEEEVPEQGGQCEVVVDEEEEKLLAFTPATVRGAIYIDSKSLRQILNPIPLNLQKKIRETLVALLTTKSDIDKVAMNW